MRTAMILAAGRGERLRPLTDTCPKPMVKLGGKPLLEYHVLKLVEAGFERVVINHAWLGEQIESYFGDGRHFGIEICYSPEQMALETGGGINQALPLLGKDPFFVVNGDIYAEYPFDHLPTLADQDIGHLLLVHNPSYHEQGDFSLDGDRIMPRYELAYTFSGMAIYRPSMFQDAPSGAFPLPQLWRPWIEKCQLSGSVVTDFWSDIGTIERLEQAQQYLNSLRKSS